MGSNPTRAALFFSSEKKELFGLVAFPFFLFIEKSFHVLHAQRPFDSNLKDRVVLQLKCNMFKMPLLKKNPAKFKSKCLKVNSIGLKCQHMFDHSIYNFSARVFGT